MLLCLCIMELSACKDPTTAQGRAEKFLDFYYVEADQQRAQQLSYGLAHEKLSKEIKAVSAVRRGAQPPEKRISYRLHSEADGNTSDRKHLIYSFQVDTEGGILKKRILLSMRKIEGRWMVSNYSDQDSLSQ